NEQEEQPYRGPEPGEREYEDREAFFSRLSREVPRFERPHSPGEYREIQRQNQLIIAERLYGYLAILARSPYAGDKARYELWEAIPHGMGMLLGFTTPSDYRRDVNWREPHEAGGVLDDESRELLNGLTQEFERWL